MIKQKIVFISDTHNNHEAYTDEILSHNPDVLVHCGDFSGRGTGRDLKETLDWIKKLVIPNTILTPGNHDGSLDPKYQRVQYVDTWLDDMPEGFHLLIDSSVTINGVKFYGTPWTSRFNNWYFAYENSLEAKEKFNMIPDDVDVLISHGPPFEIMDEAHGMNLGCPYILEASKRVNPKIHAFGHIHESVGEQGKYINCAQKVFVKEL